MTHSLTSVCSDYVVTHSVRQILLVVSESEHLFFFSGFGIGQECSDYVVTHSLTLLCSDYVVTHSLHQILLEVSESEHLFFG